MRVIDATNLIAGRIASEVAKSALKGEEIVIVNCDKAVITGKKDRVLSAYKEKRARGTPRKGPFVERSPEKMLRRMVRGMLPYKRERGKRAVKRIKYHSGVPEAFKKSKKVTIESANISKLQILKYVELKEISKSMGAKK